MKITTRIGYAVRKFHTDNGKWPDTVSLGRKELSELSGHYGHMPLDITFGAADGSERTFGIRHTEAESELTCSISG